MTERVQAIGYLVSFNGDMPVKVEKILGVAPGGLKLQRTRTIWDSGRPSMGTRTAEAIKAARRVRQADRA